MRFLLAVALVVLLAALVSHAYDYPFQNPYLPVPDRVADLVSRLTLEEKVAQISHGGAENNGPAPAITRLGINPFQWGTECLRGDVDAGLATSFPQALGLAASFDRDVIFNMAKATADEVRAKYNNYTAHGDYSFHTGINCWSPVVNIARDPRWGRAQETYGECPYLTAELAKAYVSGLQGTERYYEALATCKHADVYAGPENTPVSRFVFDAQVTERDWRLTYLPAFVGCIDAGVQSMMCSYNSINGVPACANKQLLQNYLRDEFGFDGFVISDQGALECIYQTHNYTKTAIEAAVAALEAGCDMEDANYEDNVFAQLVPAVQQGLVDESLVNVAVSRAFTARMRLGEFDPRDWNPYNDLSLEDVDSEEHRILALDFAQRSFVLLSNNRQTLPLNPDSLKRVAVIGPAANDWNALFGDYPPLPSFYTTPLDALKNGDYSFVVDYVAGCSSLLCTSYTNSTAVQKAANAADVAFVFVGLGTDVESEGLDRTGIDLPGHQMDVVRDVCRSARRTVVVLFTAGPVNIADAQSCADAVLLAWYPAEQAGTAVAQTLFGMTWPSSIDQVPPITNYSMHGRTYRYATYTPLYPFGYGLSYTTFAYGAMKLSATTVSPCQTVVVTGTVKNLGTMPSDEVVQVYVSWAAPSAEMPQLQLAGFRRLRSVHPGETRQVAFVLDARRMAVLQADSKTLAVEAGKLTVYLGGQQPNQARRAPSNVLQASFTVVGSTTPVAQCGSA